MQILKNIILTLTVGLVVGYGITNAFDRSEVNMLKAENDKRKQQVVKLSEQLLLLQKQIKQSPYIFQRKVMKQPVKNLTSSSLNKKKRTNKNQEQIYLQSKQATNRIRIQQKQQAQQSNNGLNKQLIKTTVNGTVL